MGSTLLEERVVTLNNIFVEIGIDIVQKAGTTILERYLNIRISIDMFIFTQN
jgi:hypothetical protein